MKTIELSLYDYIVIAVNDCELARRAQVVLKRSVVGRCYGLGEQYVPIISNFVKCLPIFLDLKKLFFYLISTSNRFTRTTNTNTCDSTPQPKTIHLRKRLKNIY